MAQAGRIAGLCEFRRFDALQCCCATIRRFADWARILVFCKGFSDMRAIPSAHRRLWGDCIAAAVRIEHTEDRADSHSFGQHWLGRLTTDDSGGSLCQDWQGRFPDAPVGMVIDFMAGSHADLIPAAERKEEAWSWYLQTYRSVLFTELPNCQACKQAL